MIIQVAAALTMPEPAARFMVLAYEAAAAEAYGTPFRSPLGEDGEPSTLDKDAVAFGEESADWLSVEPQRVQVEYRGSGVEIHFRPSPVREPSMNRNGSSFSLVEHLLREVRERFEVTEDWMIRYLDLEDTSGGFKAWRGDRFLSVNSAEIESWTVPAMEIKDGFRDPTQAIIAQSERGEKVEIAEDERRSFSAMALAGVRVRNLLSSIDQPTVTRKVQDEIEDLEGVSISIISIDPSELNLDEPVSQRVLNGAAGRVIERLAEQGSADYLATLVQDVEGRVLSEVRAEYLRQVSEESAPSPF